MIIYFVADNIEECITKLDKETAVQQIRDSHHLLRIISTLETRDRLHTGHHANSQSIAYKTLRDYPKFLNACLIIWQSVISRKYPDISFPETPNLNRIGETPYWFGFTPMHKQFQALLDKTILPNQFVIPSRNTVDNWRKND